MIDNRTGSGTCTLCGEAIGSATALYCVGCLRKCTHSCPECMKDGKLVHRYKKHEGEGLKVDCRRCAEPHDDKRQLVCPTCKNERTIFEIPDNMRPLARQK